MAVIADVRVLNPRQFQPGTYDIPQQNVPVGTTMMRGRVDRRDANDPALEGFVVARYEVDISRDNGVTWYRFVNLPVEGGEKFTRGDTIDERVLLEYDFHQLWNRVLLSSDNPADANTLIRGRLIVNTRISSETWVTLYDDQTHEGATVLV